jgi:hypothetical protein
MYAAQTFLTKLRSKSPCNSRAEVGVVGMPVDKRNFGGCKKLRQFMDTLELPIVGYFARYPTRFASGGAWF